MSKPIVKSLSSSDITSKKIYFYKKSPYINHISHIQNIPNPCQVQYMNYTHSVAWTFNKEKKRKFKKYFYNIK